MTVYLVRHAAALRRGVWNGPERLRPLSGGGHRQARRLIEALGHAEVSRLVSSPELRCRQTLEPLAAQRGLPLEADERFAEGADVGRALARLARLESPDSVVCSSGAMIPRLLDHLRDRGLHLEDELRCEKASVWVLEGPARAPDTARYLSPPPKRRRGAPGGSGAAAQAAPEELEPSGDPEKRRFAVLDLGSTSFHLLVADAFPTGEVRRVLRERKMLRLGAMIAGRQRIPRKVCRRALDAARELRHHAEDADAHRLLPVATSALRDAANGAELAEALGEVLGTPVTILSGAQEASLIFAAFQHRLQLGSGSQMGLDLGGGSLELAIGDDRGVRWETTLPLGVARLHRELVAADPMRSREERAIRARVRELLAPHLAQIRRRAPRVCVATGGTMSALARRVVASRTSWPARAVGQLFVPFSELRELRRELVASTHDERLVTPGIQKQRADLLPTGVVILEAAASQLGAEGFIVSDWGLREGVILQALGLAPARPD